MRKQNIEVLPMSECDKYKSLFSNYIDGDLFPEQRKSLEDHLTKCPPCQRAVQRLKIICKSLRNMPVLTTSPDFESRLHQQIAGLGDGRSINLSFSIQNWKIPAAASFAVIILVGIFLFFDSSDNIQNSTIPENPSITNPMNLQKSSEESVLSNQNIQGQNKGMVSSQEDSTKNDTEKNLNKSGLKLVDEK
jgi:hypothetical protein